MDDSASHRQIAKHGTSSPAWRVPSWLTGWSAEHQVPVPLEQISQEEAETARSLTPCDPKRAALMLGQTVELYGVPNNWDRIATFYLEAVADVPPDLLALALRRIRLESKWFPKPAEIRAAIDAELSERKTAAFRLRLAMKAAQHEAANRPVTKRWDDMTPDEQQAHERRMAAVKSALGSATKATRIPREGKVGRGIDTRPLPGEDDPEVQAIMKRMGA
jgi:hypothetical protein